MIISIVFYIMQYMHCILPVRLSRSITGLTISSEVLKNHQDFRTYKKRQDRGALCASNAVYMPVNEQCSTQCNDEIGVFRKSLISYVPPYLLGAKYHVVFPQPFRKIAQLSLKQGVHEAMLLPFFTIDKVLIVPQVDPTQDFI